MLILATVALGIGGHWLLSGKTPKTHNGLSVPSSTCGATELALQEEAKGFAEITGDQVELSDNGGMGTYATSFIIPGTVGCKIYKYASGAPAQMSCHIDGKPSDLQAEIEPCLAKLGDWTNKGQNYGSDWVVLRSAKTNQTIGFSSNDNYDGGFINFARN
jgi:hypothetical protein